MPPSNKDSMPPAAGDSVDQPGHTPALVVAIGASAGGHAPLEQIFARLPTDSGLAFVVLMHLAADTPSHLPDLLRHYSRMPVLTAEEGMAVQANCVYVIPPGQHLTLRGGALHLNPIAGDSGRHHAIDLFLASLAEDQGENSVAVILSGFGNDGSQGVQRIKECGGMVLVQEPQTAINRSMPEQAIDTGAVDLILPAEEIASHLQEMAGGWSGDRTNAFIGHEVPHSEELHLLFALLKAKTGHDFSAYKRNTVLRRIDRRMMVNEVQHFRRYLAILEEDPKEAETLYQELLIGVTGFFRDTEAFQLLGSEVIPRLFANRGEDEPVRIWHACCATGEEAYSVAMLVQDYLEKQHLQIRVQIFATDLDEVAINRARAGIYGAAIENEVAQPWLRKYFTRQNGDYLVDKTLREMIVFAHHDIIKDPPFSRLDLLVCRNFLIYLNMEMQRRLMVLFHQVLNPGGFLFLGSAETVGLQSNFFVPLDKKWKIFVRQNGEQRLDLPFPFFGPIRRLSGVSAPLRQTEPHPPTPAALADKVLMERYVPARVIVNERNEVVHFSKQAGAYLLTPEGEPTRDVIRLVREELRPALRAAIYKTCTEQRENVFQGIKVKTASGESLVNLIVLPLQTSEQGEKLVLVIFEPTPPPPVVPAVLGETTIIDGANRDTVILHLEEQLRVTSEQLQATCEQLESSNEGFLLANEELMATNEELQSANEELQATNEELETSKEELQALNEELITVNVELQNKIEELDRSNSDLENLFTSAEIATLFLDRDLNLNRFSPAMAALFNLIPADCGRPFRHLSTIADWTDLPADASLVMGSNVSMTREVQFPEEGRSFIMRLLPYRNTSDSVDGIVITLIDITLRKQMELAINQSAATLKLFIEQAPASLAMFDRQMRYLQVSHRWLVDYGLEDRDILGMSHYAIFPEIGEEWKEAHRRGLKGEILRAEADLFVRADGSHQWIRWEIRPWVDAEDNIGGIVIFTEDITEIKKAEELLRRYELLAAHSRDIILFIDREDGQLVEVNSAACLAYGYSRDELRHLTVHDLRGSDAHLLTQDQMAQADLHGILFETVHCRKDGTTFAAEVNSKGAVIGGRRLLLSIVRDITERKAAEEALRASEERRRLALEATSEALWDYHLSSGKVYRSQRYYQLVNRRPEEDTQDFAFFVSTVHPDDRQRVQREIEAHIQGLSEAIDFDYRLHDAGNEERWLRVRGKAVERDDDGVPLRMVGTLADVTLLKQQERELILSEQHRKLALSAAQAGTWEWDLASNENHWSDEIWQLYGLEAQSCRPSYEAWIMVVHPDDRVRVERDLFAAVERGKPFRLEWRVNREGDGERWLMSRGKPTFDSLGRLERYVGIVLDITERKENEASRNRLETQLQQAQKMEAIGTLAGGIAHDFNNILAAILGYTEMAKEGVSMGVDVHRDLNKVLDAAGRATNLVRQILTFSRHNRTERVALEPIHLVKEAIKLLRPALPSTITISPIRQEGNSAILADPTQIHQVVMNLCTNAFHAMETTGGVLAISLCDCELGAEELLHQPKAQPGRFVRLSIADTGPGIPSKIMEKIFDPYFTTKEVGRGTGLGLPIVHSIATAAGGFVQCDSVPGAGATFHIYFPAIDNTPPQNTAAIKGETSGRERILLVDDEVMLAEMEQSMLERLGYQVTICTCSQAALALFREDSQRFDAVITDQTMPEMTGIELARRMLAIRPELPIILCTGYSSLINEQQARASGLQGFAMKPLSNRELSQLLRQVLDKGGENEKNK